LTRGYAVGARDHAAESVQQSPSGLPDHFSGQLVEVNFADDID
jgi:hypothetical protein